MLNKAQRARVDAKIASAINCTVRVQHGDRMFITGVVTQAAFICWSDDLITTKGRLALFRMTINVVGAVRTPEEGPLYRQFTVSKLPYGAGTHALIDHEYEKLAAERVRF